MVYRLPVGVSEADGAQRMATTTAESFGMTKSELVVLSYCLWERSSNVCLGSVRRARSLVDRRALQPSSYPAMAMVGFLKVGGQTSETRQRNLNVAQAQLITQSVLAPAGYALYYDSTRLVALDDQLGSESQLLFPLFDSPPPPAPSPPPNGAIATWLLVLLIVLAGTALAFCVICLIVAIVLYCLRKRHKRNALVAPGAGRTDSPKARRKHKKQAVEDDEDEDELGRRHRRRRRRRTSDGSDAHSSGAESEEEEEEGQEDVEQRLITDGGRRSRMPPPSVTYSPPKALAPIAHLGGGARYTAGPQGRPQIELPPIQSSNAMPPRRHAPRFVDLPPPGDTTASAKPAAGRTLGVPISQAPSVVQSTAGGSAVSQAPWLEPRTPPKAAPNPSNLSCASHAVGVSSLVASGSSMGSPRASSSALSSGRADGAQTSLSAFSDGRRARRAARDNAKSALSEVLEDEGGRIALGSPRSQGDANATGRLSSPLPSGALEQSARERRRSSAASAAAEPGMLPPRSAAAEAVRARRAARSQAEVERASSVAAEADGADA
mmetsp:Transcript_11758/g.36356  ORF Transcript_11758/g.36356 Transcript_11758/m.36356 type:complete len:551 (+) Transcript_11758:123-1775(+)